MIFYSVLFYTCLFSPIADFMDIHIFENLSNSIYTNSYYNMFEIINYSNDINYLLGIYEDFF